MMDNVRKCTNCKEYGESFFCGYRSSQCKIFGSLDMDQDERHPDTTGETCPEWKKRGQTSRELRLGLYRHFKGNVYKVLGVAEHTETGESMVVYVNYRGERKLYIRPLDMFLSKVDKEKYPGIEQEYRFEYI